MYLFNVQLNNERDWENVFQSITTFTPLVEHILNIEKLPSVNIENLSPGTNAVFKIGKYVIKIFAPMESKVEQRLPQTEVFATQHIHRLGISASNVIAHGLVKDKYNFAYIIFEYVEDILAKTFDTMAEAEKMNIGRKLREITDRMNTPCESFNDIDIMNDRSRDRCWDRYSEKFKQERLAYIKSHNYGEKVFVHGDLCGDNLLLTPHNELYIIDFADALLAPKAFEHALLAIESELDPMILRGYFENDTVDDFIETCLSGILLYGDFETVEELLYNPDDYNTIDDLRKTIRRKIKIYVPTDIRH